MDWIVRSFVKLNKICSIILLVLPAPLIWVLAPPYFDAARAGEIAPSVLLIGILLLVILYYFGVIILSGLIAMLIQIHINIETIANSCKNSD